MLCFTLIAHWLACIWYAIGRSEAIDGHQLSWLTLLETQQDTATLYISSLYFTVSAVTSVGFGNISGNTIAEKIFVAVAMLIGGKCFFRDENGWCCHVLFSVPIQR